MTHIYPQQLPIVFEHNALQIKAYSHDHARTHFIGIPDIHARTSTTHIHMINKSKSRDRWYSKCESFALTSHTPSWRIQSSHKHTHAHIRIQLLFRSTVTGSVKLLSGVRGFLPSPSVGSRRNNQGRFECVWPRHLCHIWPSNPSVEVTESTNYKNGDNIFFCCHTQPKQAVGFVAFLARLTVSTGQMVMFTGCICIERR